MPAVPPQSARVLVRPRSAQVRGGLLAIFVVSLVLFGVLGFLGISNGTWPLAVAGETISLVVIVVGLRLASTTYIAITADQIVERGFWGILNRHPLDTVHSVVLAHVFDGGTADDGLQLVVRDAADRRLLRMRGEFWESADVLAVVEAIGHPVVEPPDPMTLTDFFERYPGAAYWFERRRLLIGLSIVGGLILIVGLVFGVMSVLDIPFADGS